MHVGRLAGDREVAAEPAGHDRVGRALVELLGLLVGDADQPHADAILLGDIASAHIIAARPPFMS